MLVSALGAASVVPAAGLGGSRVDGASDRALVGANIRVSGAAAGISDELSASVAYNSAANQFLVVWRDDRDAGTRGWDIRGQRISANGARLGPNFRISGAAATENEDLPDVTYNPTDNEYLVVWQDDRDFVARGWDIWGQRISAGGARLGPNFRISGLGATNDEWVPAVAFSTATNRYMVVWWDDRDHATRGSDIWGRRVSATGARIGANFRISRGAAVGDEQYPSIAFNSGNGQFLVVWQDDRDATTRGWDIRGQRLSGAGARLGPNILLSGSTATGDERAPDVAYNPAANQYRVVWQDDRDSAARGWDIRGQRLSALGARLGPNVRISDAAATSDDVSPAVVFNTTVNRYLVVWTDYRDAAARGSDVWGQQLAPTGGPVGAAFRVSGGGATGYEYGVALASSTGSARYLAAWEDDRNWFTRFWDIWAQRGDQ